MLPAFDSGEDLFGIGGPNEWLGVVVGLGEEAVDSGLQFGEGSEDAPLEAPSSELGEEAFHSVEPGGARRREVERPAGMPGQPLAHLGMLVGGIVVDDGMDRLSRRHLRLDGVEEADELLVPVALHVAADDGAVEDVERGEQGGGAVPLVIVRHGSGAPRLHRQSRLGAVEGLDLALLVDREDDGVGRRVDVEADHVLELLGELGVIRQFKRADTVRRELVGIEDALHGAQAHASRPRQHSPGPVGGFTRRRPERQVDDALHPRSGQRLLAGLSRLVAREAIDALTHEAFLPAPHHRLRQLGAAHDLVGAAPIGRRQDDLGALDVLLLGIAIPDNGLQPEAILERDSDADPCSHGRSMNCFAPSGNPLNASHH